MGMTGRLRLLFLASLDVGGPGGSYRKNFLRKGSGCSVTCKPVTGCPNLMLPFVLLAFPAPDAGVFEGLKYRTVSSAVLVSLNDKGEG